MNAGRMTFQKRGTMTNQMKQTYMFLFIALTAFLDVGCSPSSVNYKTESSSVLCVGDNCGGNMPQQQNMKAEVALLDQSQMLSSLISCTGAAATSATLNKFKALKSNFSQEGKADDMTAPLALASLTLSGELCRDIAVAESAQPDNLRRFFQGFGTLNASSAAKTITQASLINSVQNFAKSCYGRTINQEEVVKAQEAFDSAAFSTSGNTRQAAVYLCTLMLASSAALHY